MHSQEPLISVVTPFRNTAPYLAQCIDSVLSQTHRNFEYILSDNCSSDGSTAIAEAYARKDSRIRLIRQPQTLAQVGHYNQALSEIGTPSQYCKIVQADDYIFPECLRMMAEAFAQSETIGLVSSYDIKANAVRGSGFPYPTTMLAGHEVARLYLRKGLFVFGSPNTVMYRSCLVRADKSFFAEDLLHEDTEKCLQILEHWDFGFVHQVLSFMRTENVNHSISAGARDFNPNALDTYINVQRYASRFLDDGEAQSLKREVRRQYYRGLAHEILHFRSSDFWLYQKQGLQTLGQTLDGTYLTIQLGRTLLGMMANPGRTFSRVLKSISRWSRKRRTTATRTASSPIDEKSFSASLSGAINADL
jgi:glycosyltransferase involved in cell wall biosynthesis